ncbi:MAG TPA: hypothetical protein VI408_15170 [Gaiellaceae bacterium]
MSRERIQTSDLVQDDADRPMTRDQGGLEPLFDSGRTQELRDRWHGLQARFVDDPQETVHEADALVAELLRDLAQSFDQARSGLEEQWTRGDDVSTEELRLTLQRYRSFFERLLEV